MKSDYLKFIGFPPKNKGLARIKSFHQEPPCTRKEQEKKWLITYTVNDQQSGRGREEPRPS
jgi:hypothetical protein